MEVQYNEKYICDVCGYIYDEAAGDPDNGIDPGTKWEDVPEDFLCPLCGVGKTSSLRQSKYIHAGVLRDKVYPCGYTVTHALQAGVLRTTRYKMSKWYRTDISEKKCLFYYLCEK